MQLRVHEAAVKSFDKRPMLLLLLFISRLQYAAAARPLGSYPTLESSGAGRDPVQSLLEAYPNPQTESQKIVKMLEMRGSFMMPHALR